jgi:hypothetical protein
MRTVGRKIRPGERRRIQCDHCNALFDKRQLRRDAEGLWTCPQEGPGRDGTTLTRGNAEALRAFTQRLRPTSEVTGRYPEDDMTPIPGLTPPTPT